MTLITCKHCDWQYEWIDVGLVGSTRGEKAKDFWAMVNHATSHVYEFTGFNWEELRLNHPAGSGVVSTRARDPATRFNHHMSKKGNTAKWIIHNRN